MRDGTYHRPTNTSFRNVIKKGRKEKSPKRKYVTFLRAHTLSHTHRPSIMNNISMHTMRMSQSNINVLCIKKKKKKALRESSILQWNNIFNSTIPKYQIHRNHTTCDSSQWILPTLSYIKYIFSKYKKKRNFCLIFFCLVLQWTINDVSLNWNGFWMWRVMSILLPIFILFSFFDFYSMRFILNFKSSFSFPEFDVWTLLFGTAVVQRIVMRKGVANDIVI